MKRVEQRVTVYLILKSLIEKDTATGDAHELIQL